MGVPKTSSRACRGHAEAVECLQARYDKPRLIHQTHVRLILESPGLKDGTGEELRRLHDTIQQHLRALKSLGHEPPGSFVTSLLELKLDATTMFEWQRHSQTSVDIPPYGELLEFVNLRAQASESSTSEMPRKSTKHETPHGRKSTLPGKPIASFAASAGVPNRNCIVCKEDKHPLYACMKFRALSHEDMVSTLKFNGLCLNCMSSGHYAKNCRSLHKCKKCQRLHHTLLHLDHTRESRDQTSSDSTTPISTLSTMGPQSNLLLMTCCILVEAPDGSTTQARAILDSASSASFVSERLAQNLHLPCVNQSTRISGVAGLSCSSSAQSITDFKVSSLHSPSRKFDVKAVIVSRVTCDLPLHPTPFNPKWKHLSGLKLADPDFGQPGRIDLLLGVETFVDVLHHGRRLGAPTSPVAFETEFGWVLAGRASPGPSTYEAAAHHVSLLLGDLTGDDLLRQFWEVEEKPTSNGVMSLEERTALGHFIDHHDHLADGRFVVPLPRKTNMRPLGESRAQAVRRFVSFERSLRSRGLFQEFEAVIREYFQMGHAEEVPEVDLLKLPQDVFYLPMHAVRKESSTTTKVRAVFDASAKTSTGVSLNDTLLVGPTVHSSLVDVLLRFRTHRVALTADVSKMYRAIALAQPDRDLYRFVWRSTPHDPLKDFRMTRVTFGVSASSFVANMCVKQNAQDFTLEFPLAAKTVDDAFYVDDGVTGADSVEGAVELHHQLQSLFSKAGFLLRKWNSNEPTVFQHIDPMLRDSQSVRTISDPEAEKL